MKPVAQTVEWAIAGRALPGEERSGDAAVAVPHDRGVLLAVVDGLGHGAEAADAAERARDEVAARAGESLERLMGHCHDVLRGMRGAAVALVDVRRHDPTLEWLAVGNVEALVVRDRDEARRHVDAVLQQAGVVGMQLPALRPREAPFGAGDVLVLATDGITRNFITELRPAWAARPLADWILRHHGRDNDDALALVARRVAP